MAIIATKNPTLLDWAKSLDPNGRTATVVELLNQTNEILNDMVWTEANGPTSHRTTVRTGLPTVVWRQLYGGVPPSKSTRAQVDDTIGMLEARSEIDKDLCDLNGNTADFRLSEGYSFIEAMNEAMSQTIFYGDVRKNPERFTGLQARFSSLSAANAQNVLSANGATANKQASIYLVVWGPNTIEGIFPKGSAAGLIHEDLGVLDAFDPNNNRFRAYADRWQWKGGITVRDWRYVVRACNIDVTALLAKNAAAPDLIDIMIRMMNRIPTMGMGRPAFYMNRTLREMLMIQAKDQAKNVLAIKEGAEQFTTGFLGIPVRVVDQLALTEAVVS